MSASRRSTHLGVWPPARPDESEAAAADDALRAEDDDRDQDRPADHTDVVACLLKDERKGGEKEGADDRTQHVAAAPEHGERQHLNGPWHAVLVGVEDEEEV